MDPIFKLDQTDSPTDKAIHIIGDNYATHKHAKVTTTVDWLRPLKHICVSFISSQNPAFNSANVREWNFEEGQDSYRSCQRNSGGKELPLR
jgi:hypothetical protein